MQPVKRVPGSDLSLAVASAKTHASSALAAAPDLRLQGEVRAAKILWTEPPEPRLRGPLGHDGRDGLPAHLAPLDPARLPHRQDSFGQLRG